MCDTLYQLMNGAALFRPNFFRPPKTQDCQEVWFAGAHADVGGGYAEKEAGLGRISLRWMLAAAKAHGLRTNPVLEQTMLDRIGDPSVPDHLAKQHDESIKGFWRTMAWLPRRTFADSATNRCWLWPNLATRRVIREGALIHCSVNQRMSDASLNYKPPLPEVYQFVGCEKVVSLPSNYYCLASAYCASVNTHPLRRAKSMTGGAYRGRVRSALHVLQFRLAASNAASYLSDGGRRDQSALEH